MEASALNLVSFSRSTPLDLASANANMVVAVTVGKKNKVELLTYEKNGMKRRSLKVARDYVAGPSDEYCDEAFEGEAPDLEVGTEMSFEAIDLR